MVIISRRASWRWYGGKVKKTGRVQSIGCGFHAIEARDGAEAISIYAERRKEISVVLLDLVMPNTSGSETLAMLRYYAPALPIVVISGYSAPAARAARYASRASVLMWPVGCRNIVELESM